MADAKSTRVALVTGGASGIGLATAEGFVSRGYRTVIVDRVEAAGLSAQSKLRESGECAFVLCDVTDDSSVRRAVEQAVANYGRLDVAFNAAGIDGEPGKATADGSIENWHRVLAVDLTGLWYCMRHEIPQMLKVGGGVIVNCASVAGLVGAPYVSAYVAAKHGVVGLTKSAALEYARSNIRINAVCPGMIDTPMSRAGMTDEIRTALLNESPLGRLGSASEVASAVLWLCDPSAAFVSGQAIAIDGAWTAR
jgi:NAD(P)-dependent dehydrogenase (short-subunit alcohol dehydrogenase family)